MDYKRILNLFLEKRLDLLFYYRENLPKEYAVRFMELKRDRLFCLVPAGHPLAQKEEISVCGLSDFPVIACSPLDTPLAIAAFQEKVLADHPREKIQYCSSIEAAHCLVGAGMGVCLLPGMLCLDTADYAAVPLSDGTELSFGIFCHDREQNTCLKSLIRLLSCTPV